MDHSMMHEKGDGGATGDIKYSVEWTTLAEYLDYLVKRGVSCNVASFVGATTVACTKSAMRPSSHTENSRE